MQNAALAVKRYDAEREHEADFCLVHNHWKIITELGLIGQAMFAMLSTLTGASRDIRGGETKMINHPNRSTTYTVLNRHGVIQDQGVSLAVAAQIVLGYDGNTYEIRRSEDGFDLWVSSVSRNSSAYNGVTKSRIFSTHTDEALAEADIYRQVIRNAAWFESCEVMTDADYAEYVAESDTE